MTPSEGGRRTRSPLPAPLGEDAAGRPPRFAGRPHPGVDDRFVERLRGVCPRVSVSGRSRVEAGRDWWPISVRWALSGRSTALADVVVEPSDAAEVAAVLAVCNDGSVPVTPFAGASGVCGGSVPLFGGVSMDLTRLAGIVAVDDSSLHVDVRAGTFGDSLEADLRSGHALTLGHWPQSVALSTVGGWLACRGAGQYSTRYGKIEDMVVGLEVALADGRLVRTGGRAPRSATGPDLTQLFVGSEGTLGVVTEARLRVHPRPNDERRAAWAFGDFAEGLEACRWILRRGATPAVLRLYDRAESARQFDVADSAVLVVIDEGDPTVIGASMDVVATECGGAHHLGDGPAGRWLEHRNELPALESLVRAGVVADTVEVAASWAVLPAVYSEAMAALAALDATIAASAHQSHAYLDGACLYFTFAGTPPPGDDEAAESYYRRAFDAVTGAVTAHGGAVSHHHGIGVNRARYMASQLGPAMAVLQSVKDALDPRGILNPGKLGLASPWAGADGGVSWGSW